MTRYPSTDRPTRSANLCWRVANQSNRNLEGFLRRGSDRHDVRGGVPATQPGDDSCFTASEHILSIGAGGNPSRSDSVTPLKEECYTRVYRRWRRGFIVKMVGGQLVVVILDPIFHPVLPPPHGVGASEGAPRAASNSPSVVFPTSTTGPVDPCQRL